MTLAAEWLNWDLGVLMGVRGGCGQGDPRISQGLPGAFSSLTLAPHGPSDGRGPLSSCQDTCSLMGIFRRGPWACVLEPSQAAAQRADITRLTSLPSGLRDFRPVPSTTRAGSSMPRPGPRLGPHHPAWIISAVSSCILRPLVPHCLLRSAVQQSLSNCKPNYPLPCLKLFMAP